MNRVARVVTRFLNNNRAAGKRMDLSNSSFGEGKVCWVVSASKNLPLIFPSLWSGATSVAQLHGMNVTIGGFHGRVNTTPAHTRCSKLPQYCRASVVVVVVVGCFGEGVGEVVGWNRETKVLKPNQHAVPSLGKQGQTGISPGKEILDRSLLLSPRKSAKEALRAELLYSASAARGPGRLWEGSCGSDLPTYTHSRGVVVIYLLHYGCGSDLSIFTHPGDLAVIDNRRLSRGYTLIQGWGLSSEG